MFQVQMLNDQSLVLIAWYAIIQNCFNLETCSPALVSNYCPNGRYIGQNDDMCILIYVDLPHWWGTMKKLIILAAQTQRQFHSIMVA